MTSTTSVAQPQTGNMGAIYCPMLNEYGANYGSRIFLFPCPASDWLSVAYAAAINRVIEKKYTAICFALERPIEAVFKDEEPSGDAWSQRWVTRCDSLDAAIRAAYEYHYA